MLELLRRLGKLIKYFSQSIVVLILIALPWCDPNPNYRTVILLTILAIIVAIEVIARTIVWIVSGYFETKPTVDPMSLKRMRDYYSYQHLRKKISQILKEIQS